MPLTLGTAGHIDHGKTALVRALTGVDTDRLPEERERGISIELGYAPLDAAVGRRLSVVDVPGHERFVRTMVAGATGIDLYLMAVAADDGVMPQTREHAARAGGARRRGGRRRRHEGRPRRPGARGRRGARRCCPGAEPVAVLGAQRGAGSTTLRAALDRVAARRARAAGAPGRPACCTSTASFTIRGAGTVVTGTLWSGTVAARRRGDACCPPAGAPACARCRCTTSRSSAPRRASAWR